MMRLSKVFVFTGAIWFTCGLGIALLMPDEDRLVVGHIAVAGWFLAATGIVIHLFSVGLMSLKIIGTGFGVVATGAVIELFQGETALLEKLINMGALVMGAGILVGMLGVLGGNRR